jgi:hypothetical protein
MTPALLTRRFRRGTALEIRSAAAATEARLARSMRSKRTSAFGYVLRIRAIASAPVSVLREARMTLAAAPASASAAS